MRPKGSQNGTQTPLQKLCFSLLRRPWRPHGRVSAPKPPQDGHKTPKAPPGAPKTFSKRPQDGPRWPQDGPRWPQDGPKTAPRPPKRASKAFKDLQRLSKTFKGLQRPSKAFEDFPKRCDPRPLICDVLSYIFHRFCTRRLCHFSRIRFVMLSYRCRPRHPRNHFEDVPLQPVSLYNQTEVVHAQPN